MASLSWLHLTDLHRGMKSQEWLWPSVREIFFADLERLHEKSGPWDLVLFTGDLTQQGAIEEFKQVDDIFKELWQLFHELGSDPLLLSVPGNHDLVRPNNIDPSVLVLEQWEQQEKVQSIFWEDSKSPYRQIIDQSFYNYNNWWGNQPYRLKEIQTGILPGDFLATIDKGDSKFGIVGLNSAFLQLTGNNYKGKLVLHPLQFHSIAEGDGVKWAKNHDACLFMTHHPPEWLYEKSRSQLNAEIIPHGRFAIHICGHMHETAYYNISEAGTESKILFQGKSLFGLEYFGFNQERLHGYSVGKIELTDNQGKLIFWPREARLQGSQRNIVPDFSMNLTDDLCTEPVNFKKISGSELKNGKKLNHKIKYDNKSPISNKIFHNLPQPDYERFIGREKELKQVQELLSSKSRHFVITIDGVGGIGKSALALESAYIYLHHSNELPEIERFEAIVWTTAKQNILTGEGITLRQPSLHTLEDIYTAIYICLKGEDITYIPRGELIRSALSRQRTLVIVDNFETIDDERVLNFIRDVPEPTKIIVTTRHRIDVAYPIRLTGMNENESREYIIDECGKKNVNLTDFQIELLIRRTGGNPLAITWTVAQMGFGHDVESVMNRLGEPNNDIAKFCFEEAVRIIQERTAYKLLLALSLFQFSVERELIGKVTGCSSLDRDDGLVELEKLSLVNVKEGRFSLSQLTKIFAASELKKNPELEFYLNASIQKNVDVFDKSDIKVFISYASDDRQTARKLYEDLKKAGVKPWMDVEDLLPGQNWERTITQAIKESRFVIALLSSNSVLKRGFVQKELKNALDILDHYPDGDIFLIPVRIDNCEIPEMIKRVHFTDLFPSYEIGFKKILLSLTQN